MESKSFLLVRGLRRVGLGFRGSCLSRLSVTPHIFLLRSTILDYTTVLGYTT